MYLKKNVKGMDYYVDGEKIIANKYTIGKINYGKHYLIDILKKI